MVNEAQGPSFLGRKKYAMVSPAPGSRIVELDLMKVRLSGVVIKVVLTRIVAPPVSLD